VQHWTAIPLACYNVALFVGNPVAGFYAGHTSSRGQGLLCSFASVRQLHYWSSDACFRASAGLSSGPSVWL